jgi:hypothetical protein
MLCEMDGYASGVNSEMGGDISGDGIRRFGDHKKFTHLNRNLTKWRYNEMNIK